MRTLTNFNMKTNATMESLKYSSPVCEIFACESMTPLCVSSVVGSSEDFEVTDYVWQIK